MAWVGERVRLADLGWGRTLEVGSLDVNGSVREFFDGPYVGIDMRDGPGVDVVGYARELPFDDATFDVVVSTEMLEHDPTPWLSMAEMGRVLKPGGHLLITTRGNGFGEHNEPHDYWRYMPQAGGLLLDLARCTPLIDTVLDPQVPGIFLHGVRE